MTKRSPILTLVVMVVMLFFTVMAKAAVTFHADKQASAISMKEALKLVASGKSVEKCQRVKAGKNINPVNVKGSSATYHTAVGTPIENVAELMAENKPLYKCTNMEWNPETKRLARTADGE